MLCSHDEQFFQHPAPHNVQYGSRDPFASIRPAGEIIFKELSCGFQSGVIVPNNPVYRFGKCFGLPQVQLWEPLIPVHGEILVSEY